MVLINHVVGDGAAPSVLRMILICCIIMYWIWRAISRGPFRGPLVEAPLYPLKPGVSRGHMVFQGPGPLGPPRNSTTASQCIFECHSSNRLFCEELKEIQIGLNFVDYCVTFSNNCLCRSWTSWTISTRALTISYRSTTSTRCITNH